MSGASIIDADALLLIHNCVYPSPPDVYESVQAFKRHSRFPVYSVNASLGYPHGLSRIRFRSVVLHYTMFHGDFEPLTEEFREFLAASGSAFKVAIFQDEQSFLPERLAFCAEYGIDCVYTCLRPPYSDQVYGSLAGSRVINYLPGYVGDGLRRTAAKLAQPDERRPIDIGYRGRKPPASWGGAALEKYEIGLEFKRHTEGLDLVIDVETDESKRLHGRAWLRFIARCRAMLGTESGATVTPPGSAGAVPYRTISPRHFEAAAFRACQILYEGEYSGIMEAGTHYIALRKDFSNFAEVIATYRQPELRRELAENAHRDLIASELYGYSKFIRSFDEELIAAGLAPRTDRRELERVAAALYPSKLRRRALRYGNALRTSFRIGLNRARGRPPTDALRRHERRGGSLGR